MEGGGKKRKPEGPPPESPAPDHEGAHGAKPGALQAPSLAHDDFRIALGQINPVQLEHSLRTIEVRREAELCAKRVSQNPSDLRYKIGALNTEELQERLHQLEKRQNEALQAKKASWVSLASKISPPAFIPNPQLEAQQQQRRRELEREADEAVGRALLCLDEAVQLAAREEHKEKEGPLSWTHYSAVVRTLQDTLAQQLNSSEPHRWLPLKEHHWRYLQSGFEVHYVKAFLGYLAADSTEQDRRIERDPKLDQPRNSEAVADKWCQCIQLLNILQYKRSPRVPLPDPKLMLSTVCQFLSTMARFFVIWRGTYERKPRVKPSKKESMILQFMGSHKVTAPMRLQLMWFATHFDGFCLATQAETYVVMLDALVDIWVGLYQAAKISQALGQGLLMSTHEVSSASGARREELEAQRAEMELETTWEYRSCQISLEYTAWALHVLLTRHANGLPHEIDIGRASMFLHSSAAYMQRAPELLRPPQSQVSFVDLGASILAGLDTIGAAATAPQHFNIPATLLSYSSLLSSMRVQLNQYLRALTVSKASGDNAKAATANSAQPPNNKSISNSSSNNDTSKDRKGGSSCSTGACAGGTGKGCGSRVCINGDVPFSKLVSDAAGLLVSALVIRLQLDTSLSRRFIKSAKPKDQRQLSDLLAAKNVLNVARAMNGEAMLDLMLWMDSNYMLAKACIPEALGIKLAELEIKALATSMTPPPDSLPQGYPSHLALARCQVAYTCVAQGANPLALAYNAFKHCVHALCANRPEHLSKSLPPRLLIVKAMLDDMLQLALQSWLQHKEPAPLGEQLPTMDVITDVICMLWPAGAPKDHTASSTSTHTSSNSCSSTSTAQQQQHDREPAEEQKPLPKASLPPDVVSQLPRLMQVCGTNTLALEQLIQAGNPALHAEVQTNPAKLTDIMSQKKELQRVVLDSLMTSHQKRHQQVQQQLAQERQQHEEQLRLQQQFLHDRGKGSPQAPQHLLRQKDAEDPITCFESAWILWALEHLLLPCYTIGRCIELSENCKDVQQTLIRLLETAAKQPGLSLLLFLARRALSRTDVINTVPLADRHSIPRVLNILTFSQDPQQREREHQQRQQHPELSEEAWYWGRLKYAVSVLGVQSHSGVTADPEDGSSAGLVRTLVDLGKHCKSTLPEPGKQPLAALDPHHGIESKETRWKFIEEALAETAAPAVDASKRVLHEEFSHPIVCCNILCREGLLQPINQSKWCPLCLKLEYCSKCAQSASFVAHTRTCLVDKDMQGVIAKAAYQAM